jgi:phosphocarrier protein HPr
MTESRGLNEECPDAPATRPGAVVRVMHIGNQKGLHARASAKFVQTVEKFDADVRVTRCGETVGGTSILGLMMLSAAPGTDITVEATGNEAAAVIAALESLIGRHFDEGE